MRSHAWTIGAVPCFHWTQALSEAIAEGKGLWCAALRGDGHLAGCIAEGRHSPFVYSTIYDKPAVSRALLASYFDMTIAESNTGLDAVLNTVFALQCRNDLVKAGGCVRCHCCTVDQSTKAYVRK